MTHDFARQRAARNTRERKASSPPVMWFVSGLVLGVLLSFLVYLATIAPGPARPEVAANTAPAKPETAPERPQRKPEFSFYSDLPRISVDKPTRSEPVAAVPAPADAAARPAPKPAQGEAEAAPARSPGSMPAPEAMAAKTPVEVPEPVVLSLRAGAFRDMADANRRRADITLLGYPARVETVAGGAEGAKYRVQVGPFKDAAALADARGALKDQGIDAR